MKRVLTILFLASAAFAQTISSDAPTSEPPSSVQPSAPAPSDIPPPPSSVPAPPQVQQQAPAPDQTTANSASGQWVYTQQYGWVWMPYGQDYVYTPPSGQPSMYVYYPAYGWRWVVAPWVWGVGPRPFFGRWGPRHYVWWGVPHFYRPYRVYRPYHVYRGGPHRMWHHGRRW